MIVEKPAWVSHGGHQIFSMDVQPTGQRCATAGGDHKAKLWSTKPLLKDSDELEGGSSKLLATLTDHFGAVNCVRWSKSGEFVASGSDDKLVIIHEKRPGTGTTEFGTNEPPNIENWKAVTTLRGHTADVVDLAWSPDDSMLATCSLDNTIRIWNMPMGASAAVLTGHSSLVKGVAWDPIGSFLASQSDDKTVMIWQTNNWTSVHRAEGSWKKSVGSTFFRRLAWSPCGHFIITTHGFQKPSHTAQVLERGNWAGTFNFVGHNAPVVAIRFNHSLFRKNPHPEEEMDLKKIPKELQPYNVVAIGSQDCNITVWTTSNPRPVFVGKHFFTQSVVDLSWSPDGYSLFCCSLDGTIATFHFEPKELGYIVTEKEMEDFKKNRYGERGSQGSLAESPTQLLLEAAAGAKKSNSATTACQSKQATANALKAPADMGDAEDTGSAQQQAPIPPVKPIPVKQKEYRQQDGRKRIIPEALPTEEAQANGSRKERPFPETCSGEKRKLSTADHYNKSDHPSKRLSNGANNERSGVNVETRKTASVDVTEITGLEGMMSVQVCVPEDAGDAPMCLEAKLVKHSDGTTSGESDLICSQGGEIKWRDRFAGKVTALTGNTNFWAAGCEDGSLQVYTAAGRRALPCLLIGSAVAFMDCTKKWDLLLMTKTGNLHVWDLHHTKNVVNESLLPLIFSSSGASSSTEKGEVKIMSARFSRSGAPLVVLSNGHAFVFHMDMKCWARIADDTFPASSFVSLWPPINASDRELAALQQGAVTASKWGSRALVNEKYQTRAHLETQMASALSLKSPEEYKQHLVAYTRFLAREADEFRLRELCIDFLGPLFVPDSQPADTVSEAATWVSEVLGMSKRELLKSHILPSMASNRAVQRLVNEYADLLSEYESLKEPAKEAEVEQNIEPQGE